MRVSCWMTGTLRHGLAVVLCLFAVAAQAGQTCREHTPSAEELRDGLALAQQVTEALDHSGAEVAVIARVGQDLSRYGLVHSHMAYVLRDHPAGRWTVVHLLNECGAPRSNIYSEGLGFFFLDQPFRYEARIAIPSPESAARLKRVLLSDAPGRLKTERYNMLAYPFNPASQNSNQWALELYALAEARDTPIASHAEAVDWLRLAGFAPDVIHLNTATRLGADFSRFNISFNDHPIGPRLAGEIATTTVASALRLMQRRDAAMQTFDVRLETDAHAPPRT
ncbi:DUF2145 domain-containing protein [Niveibacterium sp. SC-1]|uniref:DUF2145 domain-containing protein n=1 Tax=Niveibacterium sp. SC-1 TaxID=3135646 RepID=UPI0031204BD4